MIVDIFIAWKVAEQFQFYSTYIEQLSSIFCYKHTDAYVAFYMRRIEVPN